MPNEPKKSLKIDQSKSMFAKIPKNDPNEFQQKATDQISKDIEYKEVIAKLSSQFVAILKDQTLPENKDVVSKSVENELINNLISFANQLNTDENQIEGYGSIAIIALLLNSVLMQRNKINSLSFLVEKLTKELHVKK